MRHKSFTLSVLFTGAVIFTTATGCATKKHVATRLSPIEKRVASLESKTNEQANTIESMDGTLSRTREQVNDLGSGLKKESQRVDQLSKETADAASAAAQAATKATQAQEKANEAYTRSESTLVTMEKMADFRPAGTANVHFKLGSATLDKEAKEALAKLASETASRKRYVMEVQGYTDSTGSPQTNLALSQRRAETVVRYLAVEHNVPLRSIHLMGTGEAAPAADNKTREGRKQNRRVEIRLFAPATETSSALSSAQ